MIEKQIKAKKMCNKIKNIGKNSTINKMTECSFAVSVSVAVLSGFGESVVAGECEVWMWKVGEAVEDEADVGKGDVDEALVDEDDDGNEGLIQSDGCFGNVLQLRCGGQGRLMRLKWWMQWK